MQHAAAVAEAPLAPPELQPAPPPAPVRKRRTRPRLYPERACDWCGKLFRGKARQRFCSAQCRWDLHNDAKAPRLDEIPWWEAL